MVKIQGGREREREKKNNNITAVLRPTYNINE